MKVTIEGNVNAAKQFWSEKSSEEAQQVEEVPASSVEDLINKSLDELEDEEQPAKKRQRKEANNDKLLQVFPLKVKCELLFLLHPSDSQDRAKTLVITFQYLPHAKLMVADSDVGVKVVPPLLASLFASDRGTRTPNAQLLADYDFSDFAPGRPYKWLQVLCGLRYLEPIDSASNDSKPTSEPITCTVDTILQLAKFRARAARCLIAQFRCLRDTKSMPPEVKHLSQAIGLVQKVVLTSFDRQEDHSRKTCTAIFKRDNGKLFLQVD